MVSRTLIPANGVDDTFVRDTCTGAAEGCVPSTYRISLASDGSEANSGSHSASLSADGRYVAFSSKADHLVEGDSNGFEDVFVRHTCQGASNCTPATIRVSLAQNDAEANGDSGGATISADGRYLTYTSSATNIVPNSMGASSNAYLVKIQWP